MKKFARIKKRINVKRLAAKSRSEFSQELSERQITALVVIIDGATRDFEDCLKLGFDDLPPLELIECLRRLADLLRIYQKEAPGRALTLKMTPMEYLVFIYACTAGCLNTFALTHCSSQVECAIHIEIFEQLLQLLPQSIKDSVLDTVEECAEHEKRRSKLKLLPTPS